MNIHETRAAWLVALLRGTTRLGAEGVGNPLYPSMWSDSYFTDETIAGFVEVCRSFTGQMMGTADAIGTWIAQTVGRHNEVWNGFDSTGYRTLIGEWFVASVRYPEFPQEVTPDVPGTRFRITDASEWALMGAGLTVGQTVEFSRRDRDGDYVVYEVTENDTRGTAWAVRPIALGPLSPTGDDTATLSVDVVSREEHDAAIAAQVARYDEVTRERDRLTRLVESYRNEAEWLADKALEAAVENDMCSVFDDLVVEVNQHNSYVTLKGRSRDITVTWRETYEVTVTRSEDYTLEPGEDADAEAENVADEAEPLDEADLIRLLRDNGNHSYDSHDDVTWTEN